MNTLKIFRNSKIISFSAICFLIFSCSQYEMSNRSFDNAIYKAYENGGFKSFKPFNKNIENSNNLIGFKGILNNVNAYYNTNISIPDNFITSYLDGDKNAMFSISLQNGWLNQTDVNLTNDLIQNIQNDGFSSAMSVYKSQVLALNLSENEFTKKNTFVNLMEIMNNENPNLFNPNLTINKSWSCFWAVIIFLIALVGAFSCVTVILCGLALVALGDATYHLVEECN